MGAQPGADELRMRGILQRHGVGPDATPPPGGKPGESDHVDVCSVHTVCPDGRSETDATPEPEPDAEPAEKTKPQPPAAQPKKQQKKGKRPRPGAPRSAFDTRPPSPRQSLADAWDRVPYRLKWLTYHASAAYLGWSIGLVGWVTYVTAWIARTGLVGPQAIFWYLAGAATLLLHHRTRRWWPPIAWLAAVPAASTVVGVLLYGTPHHQ